MLDLVRFVVTLQSLYPFWKDASQIEAKREERLRALLAYAARHSPSTSGGSQASILPVAR